ncbi:hypothetical protein [Mycolicibacterium sp. HS_4_1]
MTKRILITGMVEPKVDAKALAWLAASVSEMRPDEIVCIEASTDLLDQLRENFDGPIGVHTGTFDRRHEVIQLPAFYDIAPGWISTGSNGSHEDSRVPGNTALGAARRFGKSVVMGHTRRLGLCSQTVTSGGVAQSTVTGAEVGNLVDVRTARGMGRAENWQRGFGILTVDDQHVTPELVMAPPANRR